MEADASTASTLDAWNLLGGFVASWKGNVPVGLYLSRLGCSEIKKKFPGQCTVITDSKGMKHDVLLLKGSMPVIHKVLEIIRTHFRAFFTLATMICMTWP